MTGIHIFFGGLAIIGAIIALVAALGFSAIKSLSDVEREARNNGR